jgi:hypothetical protein
MIRLAFITQGTSEYDDRLRALLDATGIDPHEFYGLDYFSLVPFFVLCGATVRPQAHAHGDHLHVEGVIVEVPEEYAEAFYASLPTILQDAYADEEA